MSTQTPQTKIKIKRGASPILFLAHHYHGRHSYQQQSAKTIVGTHRTTSPLDRPFFFSTPLDRNEEGRFLLFFRRYIFFLILQSRVCRRTGLSASPRLGYAGDGGCPFGDTEQLNGGMQGGACGTGQRMITVMDGGVHEGRKGWKEVEE